MTARAFKKWVINFRPIIPDVGNRAEFINRGMAFVIDPPKSYPCVVIYTRIRRTSLTECEFYWDFVTPSDFPAASTKREKKAPRALILQRPPKQVARQKKAM